MFHPGSMLSMCVSQQADVCRRAKIAGNMNTCVCVCVCVCTYAGRPLYQKIEDPGFWLRMIPSGW